MLTDRIVLLVPQSLILNPSGGRGARVMRPDHASHGISRPDDPACFEIGQRSYGVLRRRILGRSHMVRTALEAFHSLPPKAQRLEPRLGGVFSFSFGLTAEVLKLFDDVSRARDSP